MPNDGRTLMSGITFLTNNLECGQEQITSDGKISVQCDDDRMTFELRPGDTSMDILHHGTGMDQNGLRLPTPDASGNIYLVDDHDTVRPANPMEIQRYLNKIHSGTSNTQAGPEFSMGGGYTFQGGKAQSIIVAKGPEIYVTPSVSQPTSSTAKKDCSKTKDMRELKRCLNSPATAPASPSSPTEPSAPSIPTVPEASDSFTPASSHNRHAVTLDATMMWSTGVTRHGLRVSPFWVPPQEGYHSGGVTVGYQGEWTTQDRSTGIGWNTGVGIRGTNLGDDAPRTDVDVTLGAGNIRYRPIDSLDLELDPFDFAVNLPTNGDGASLLWNPRFVARYVFGGGTESSSAEHLRLHREEAVENLKTRSDVLIRNFEEKIAQIHTELEKPSPGPIDSLKQQAEVIVQQLKINDRALHGLYALLGESPDYPWKLSDFDKALKEIAPDTAAQARTAYHSLEASLQELCHLLQEPFDEKIVDSISEMESKIQDPNALKGTGKTLRDVLELVKQAIRTCESIEKLSGNDATTSEALALAKQVKDPLVGLQVILETKLQGPAPKPQIGSEEIIQRHLPDPSKVSANSHQVIVALKFDRGIASDPKKIKEQLKPILESLQEKELKDNLLGIVVITNPQAANKLSPAFSDTGVPFSIKVPADFSLTKESTVVGEPDIDFVYVHFIMKDVAPAFKDVTNSATTNHLLEQTQKLHEQWFPQQPHQLDGIEINPQTPGANDPALQKQISDATALATEIETYLNARLSIAGLTLPNAGGDLDIPTISTALLKLSEQDFINYAHQLDGIQSRASQTLAQLRTLDNPSIPTLHAQVQRGEYAGRQISLLSQGFRAAQETRERIANERAAQEAAQQAQQAAREAEAAVALRGQVNAHIATLAKLQTRLKEELAGSLGIFADILNSIPDDGVFRIFNGSFEQAIESIHKVTDPQKLSSITTRLEKIREEIGTSMAPIQEFVRASHLPQGSKEYLELNGALETIKKGPLDQVNQLLNIIRSNIDRPVNP